MADVDGSPQSAEPRYGIGFGNIGTGYAKAKVEQEFGDAAHTDASDAYKMDPGNTSKHVRSPLLLYQPLFRGRYAAC